MTTGNASVQVSIPEMIKGREVIDERYGQFRGLREGFTNTVRALTDYNIWHSAASVAFAKAAGDFVDQMRATEGDLDDIKARLQATIDQYNTNESETESAGQSIISMMGA